MAHLIHGTELTLEIENLIKKAESYILFCCPYVQLHEKVKDCLKLRKNDDSLEIIIVFGKNEANPSKSLNEDDLQFLQGFPHITIAYEKRLHAKYYCNEKTGIIASINLHTYSINNNIEVGVLFNSKNILKNITDKALNPLTSIISDTEDISSEAYKYFFDVFTNSEKIFVKKPEYESRLFGLQQKYIGSKVELDKTVSVFAPSGAKKGFQTNSEFTKASQENHYNDSRYLNSKQFYKEQTSASFFQEPNHNSGPFSFTPNGYCIRTGEPITFNPSRPFSWPSYQTWVQFNNPDFEENFCHRCGRNSKTSKKNPLCYECL